MTYNSAEKKRWRALYIYLGAEQDRFLIGLLPHLPAAIPEINWLEEFFYIRYWNGGPHIRIRVSCRRSEFRKLVEIVKKALRTLDLSSRAVEGYDPAAVLIHEGMCRSSVVGGEVEVLEAARAPGSVEVHRYRFDQARFGDKISEMRAHQHFCRSSVFSLSLVADVRSDASRLVPAALCAIASVFSILSRGINWKVRWFAEIGSWHRTFLGLDDAAFEFAGWLADEDFLLQLRDAINCDDLIFIPAGMEYARPFIASWRREMDQVVKFSVGWDPESTEGPSRTDGLVFDLNHLMMNRLGLSIIQESYICKLMGQVVGS